MLRFNGLSPVGANPFSAMCTSPMGNTAGAVGTTANLTTQWGRGERHAVKLSFGEYASNPPASENPVAWTMAEEGGDLASENSVNQSNTLTLTSLSLGKDLAAALVQDGSITAAALSMIASLDASLVQDAQMTGSLQMTLNMAAEMVQEGQITAALGLIAWMSASLTQDADMSDSNLRGTLSMAANIVSYGDLTPEGLRDAVWNAVASSYDSTGTMGEKLNDAGSASNPWTEVIESGLTAAQILKLIAAAVQGSATGLEDGSPVFKSIDGLTDRITATYNSGTRTVTARDAT